MTDVWLSNDKVFLDGTEFENKVARIEMTLDASGERQVALFLAPGQTTVHIDGTVLVVDTPSEAAVLRRAVELLSTLDPTEIDQAALEAQTWGSPGSLTPAIITAIQEVFTYAADELEPPAEVRGSADDGHDLGAETGADG